VSVERIAELPNVGLYAGNYASPQPDGTYVVRRGGRGRTTLIGPADVGGEILAVTDMTIAADSLGCGLEGNLVGHSLMGAMLTIRLADGNVIHELWAAGEQSR